MSARTAPRRRAAAACWRCCPPARSRAMRPSCSTAAAMTELLRELRGRADVVLVDAPPMLPVTDAMVLGTKVDAVVAVARARLASRPHLVALGRALDACAAPRLGFVFVGGTPDEAQEYGGYVGGDGSGRARCRIRPGAGDRTAVRVDAGLLVGRPSHPAPPAEALVEQARAQVGHVRPARQPVAARRVRTSPGRTTRRRGTCATRVRNLAARRAHGAALPARRGRVGRRRRRVPVLHRRPDHAHADGLPRGLRPHRLADADRAAVPAVLEPVRGAVGGAAQASTPARA